MREAGEPAWAMPFPEELRKGLDSTVADMANVSSERGGGMLTAGLFLKEFVPDGVAWAHLDIAGPAFNEKGAVRLHAQGRHRRGGAGARRDRGGDGRRATSRCLINLCVSNRGDMMGH